MKRGQIWGIDLAAAMAIFVIGLVLFYFYMINHTDEAQNTINALKYDGERITDMLLSKGEPQAWTSATVVRIGITDDGIINQTKLEQFYDLSIADYKRTQGIFNTHYNYYLNFSQPMSIYGTQREYIGQTPSSSKNIIKTSRLTVYENKPVTMQIYIWE